MSWWALEVQGGGEAVAAWLAARTGYAAEERDDGTVVSAVPSREEADRIGAAAEQADPALTVMVKPLPEVDWSTRWRAGLGPRSFGRLTVVPSWVEHAPRAGEVVVVLDPESAFGSGEHGSTRGALSLLEPLVIVGDTVLDLGSGSGILAIAAVRLGAARATGVENDADVIPVAVRNAERNGVAGRVQCLEGDAGALAPLLGPADLICSNILRSVNETWIPAIYAVLRPGGFAIFSGMEQAEADLFRPRLSAGGFGVVQEMIDTGWWAVAARRP